MMIQIIPLLILWDLWRSSCACKYGDQKKFLYSRMVHQILWNLSTTLRLAFIRCDLAMPRLKLSEIVDNLKPISTWKKVV